MIKQYLWKILPTQETVCMEKYVKSLGRLCDLILLHGNRKATLIYNFTMAVFPRPLLPSRVKFWNNAVVWF
jgi:hypothetical protein